MHIPRTLAIVLAGGKGSRLGALTEKRVKPALPVAGTYRLIDVSLSNLMHSHLSDVWIVQQYLPHSLNQHLRGGRPWDLDRSHGGLLVLPPFQGAEGEGFAEGNSDSLFRQRDLIRDFDPELLLVLSADHLYTLNFLDVIDTHLAQGADLTMVTTRIDEPPTRYAVVQTNDDGLVTRFDYKPDDPEGNLIAGEMFLFNAQRFLEAMDALDEQGEKLEDYGHDLIPWFVDNKRVVEHRLDGYWMDMGTLQSYWTAHMQLIDGNGVTLDDPTWPIMSAQPQQLPARIENGAVVHDSLVSAGTTIRGTVEHSVLSPGVVVEAGASVKNCVLLDGVHVHAGVSLENVIADIGAEISGGNRRGNATSVTLIGDDGLVATSEDFDRDALLPQGF
ncbi:glucose-1-phosphate adenylyltransferase family protein [Buchananella hordeovulneris]|uniref:Glucose-1-phosphate adenylyltransferase n=1 Tax=Buchananella hordeovulneris TaxID=52770 RepID=A0A1Q5PXQ4_9ACTO|nr:sugar phosphate nucleotidyltransferase [Buchananella hordeovulneris]MDO5079704.1 sugar phosphate nucleotidyltransferase [Buchananella hordeovulneris]OKL52391.1 glucose-1-phosphate adenylyltransferase [Buchananella hordeovulneris]RRD45421.1 glucose-1-phosphate adenylyltransferase [Buchananella hordeovulneris]RRD53819.1 glucose-1-phosphate adenylyltransferase [Buchananella hordeovulneris]